MDILAITAVRRDHAYARGGVGVVRKDRAGVPGRPKILSRVEARSGSNPETACRTARSLCALRLSGVLDDRNVILLRQLCDPLHRGGLTEEVDGHDRLGASCDRLLRLYRIDE